MKKTPKLRLGIPLTAATGAYLLFSLFGCLFYLVLPPFLCSIGARIHAYLLIGAATDPSPAVGRIILMVIAHLYVLTMAIFGLLAMIKGHIRPFFILAALEIVFTFIFLLVQNDSVYKYTAGIVVNIAYCVWLFRCAYRKRPRYATKKSKAERKSIHGKL